MQPAAQRNNKYIKRLGLNITSLRLNHDDIQILTESLTQSLDVIVLTETSIADQEDAEEYNIEDYQPFISNPRKNVKRRSGGVAFYIRSGLVVKILPLETQIECCLIKVTFTP